MQTQTIDLSQFFGTSQYWRTQPMFAPKLVHTDGVQAFADQAGAYWFLDIIATEVYELHKSEPFIGLTLSVDDGKARIVANDGDDKLVFDKKIDYTDCPAGKYHFFLCDNVFMLTSEY
jgi:hypothetical protein